MERLRSKMAVIVAAAVVVASGLALTAFGKFGKSEKIPGDDVTALSDTDFAAVVTADGTVQCREPHYIYSAQQLPVKNVKVKEGDLVNKDTVLCELDTTELEAKASQQRAAIEKAEKSAKQNVAAAQHKLDSQIEGINNGTDSTLVTAADKVIQAKEAYDKAQKAYNDYKSGRDSGLNSSVYSADKSVESARQQLENAEEYYDDIKDKDEYTDVIKNVAEKDVKTARLALDQASKSRQIALRESDIAMADLAKAEDDAFQTYLTAVLAQYAVGRNVYNSAISSSDALSSAMVQTDLSADELMLRELEQNIEDACIKAGCSGTVTAVNVDPGTIAGMGTLFVVEDTGDLEVACDIKEYDITSLDEGQKVLITTESASGKVYNGTVTYTAKAAKKDEESHTDLDADAKYRILISVDDPDEDLLIGMSVRIEVSVSDDNDVVKVPEDAVYSDENGNSYVLLLTGEGPGYTVTEAKVSAGESEDGKISISGDIIEPGAMIINDAGKYRISIGKSVTME